MLIWAVNDSNHDICEYILQKDDSLANTTDKNGFTLLTLAALECDEEMMRILIKHGADVNHIRKMPYGTPNVKRDIIDLIVRYVFYSYGCHIRMFEDVISTLLQAGLEPRCLDQPNPYQNHWDETYRQIFIDEYNEIISWIRKVAVNELSAILDSEANQPDSSLFNMPREIIHLIAERVY
jgi:hypothetical protein